MRRSVKAQTLRSACSGLNIISFPFAEAWKPTFFIVTADMGSPGLLVTNHRNLPLPQLWSKRVFPIFRLNLLRSSYDSRYSRMTE